MTPPLSDEERGKFFAAWGRYNHEMKQRARVALALERMAELRREWWRRR